MSNISAGIGRGQMEVLEERIRQKRENHEFYKNLIENFESVALFTEPNEDFFSNFWLNTIIIENSNLSPEILKKHFTEVNIETRHLWKPMHLQPLYEKYHFFGNNFCGKLFDRGLCLPSGTSLTDTCKDMISGAFKIMSN